MGKIRAVILDIDGTLVDSNDAHAQSWVDALREHGRDVPFQEIRRLIGMGGDKLLAKTVGLSDEEGPGEKISKLRKQIFKQQYLPRLKPFPNSRELLQRMQSAGLRLGVATSAQKEEMGPLLELAGAADLVEERTSSSDAENSKPDPDIVAAALQKLGVRPDEAIMLGDTPYDIEAARRTGVSTIALRSGGWNDADLAGAVAIYDDCADLLRRFDESPLVATD